MSTKEGSSESEPSKSDDPSPKRSGTKADLATWALISAGLAGIASLIVGTALNVDPKVRLAISGICLLSTAAWALLKLAPHRHKMRELLTRTAQRVSPYLKGSAVLLTSAVAIGSLFVSMGTLYVTAQQNAAQNRLALKSQVADRFTKAIEQLAADKLDIRLGGIYSLRSIGKEDSDYKEQVVRTLAAFVSEYSLHDPCPIAGDVVPLDVETALQTVGDLPLRSVEDLANRRESGVTVDDLFTRSGRTNCWLGVRLTDAIYRGYSFVHWNPLNDKSNPGTNFVGAQLRRVDFTGSQLTGIPFRGAWLNSVVFDGADIQRADLRSAMIDVSFRHTNLRGSQMCSVSLFGIDLQGAHLEGANLSGSHLEDVDLSEAHLNQGTVLDGVPTWLNLVFKSTADFGEGVAEVVG